LLILPVEAETHVHHLVVDGRGSDSDGLDLAPLKVGSDGHHRPVLELACHVPLLPSRRSAVR